ncbi:MAG: PD-(D/E)XK nuclease-like domain-containing protein [Clostridia bacterium]|nr:PD-(D/E)XK nuclease-like domain-containing protein [Clostridia bacterium]
MKITQKNYYSSEMNKQYMSVSQFKDFCKCEAMAMAKINGTYQQPKSRALLLGSLFDELLTGTEKSQSVFIEENKQELFKKNGEPYADVAQAYETVEKVKQQPLMMKYLSGQTQKIMTGEIAGVPFKIKIDSYKAGKFLCDLKYMASLRSPNLFDSMVKYWGYDIQGAVYQEIVYQNTNKRLPFFLCIATKETIPHLELCEIKQYDLDEALSNVEKKVQRFQALKNGEIEPERCEEYDCLYCTATRIITEAIDSNMLGMTRKIED